MTYIILNLAIKMMFKDGNSMGGGLFFIFCLPWSGVRDLKLGDIVSEYIFNIILFVLFRRILPRVIFHFPLVSSSDS